MSFLTSLKQYGLNWATLGDQTLNCAIGGDPRQTLSARMGRNVESGRCLACRRICAFLNLFQKDHCAKAWAKWKVVSEPRHANYRRLTCLDCSNP